MPIIRNKNFTSEQLYNIRNYIQRNVCEPLTKGRKLVNLDHRKEIEKILQGDLSKCKERRDIHILKQKEQLMRKIKIVFHNPRKIPAYIERKLFKPIAQ